MDDNKLINKEIESDIFDNPQDVYHLETYDLPQECPYRQRVLYGPAQGQGPGFGPQGPGYGPPGFGSQGPGFGFPGSGFGPPGSSSGQQGPPNSPPPNFTPSKQTKSSKGKGASVKAVDPGSIRPCVFRYVYIWPRRGKGFWAWLTHVGRRSASGYRWNGRRWVYFGMDLRSIESFECF